MMINACLDLALVCHPVLAFLTIQRSKMHAQQSKWQYFVFSFFLILAVRYASSTAIETPVVDGLLCQSQDSPNPIASIYPNNATGTLNGTIAVLPIPLALARQLIPSQYKIMEHAYRDLLPHFPKDMYPAFMQAVHDHDVQAFGFNIPDFSRAGLEFPFLDLLGDNSTSFKWIPSLLMTATNLIAIKGATDYGSTVYPATFKPECDAYASTGTAGTTTFSAKSLVLGNASLAIKFATTTKEVYPLSYFQNVTNQPMFGNGKTCDNMIRLFNTSVTTAPNRIDQVMGSVTTNVGPLKGERTWKGVYGLRLDTAFIENNYLPCESLRGYGTG
ncbi:hypothetical protein IAQ61_001388 [Plenodomus lingam]|uniref:Uncharacterized protein n=1 Tax=Leptosphaeria maculans (strain JN3 / isolate v23.1.3 / race Av1-4-5-6-7-8) TaxID=985895 RepID=E4ZXW7_LEPMJ|nr:hypothetical protein LEMA_P111310.1 [Plenodomus lingam JN3]KAH9879570.1 hypothetical protein IAQ61_001388 [Plenodomus lingam]CBX96212.1 hypothetical protein LEMA_P111310.1 [Plenodomus lingam JN3]